MEKISKLLKGIIICKQSGEFLVDLILDTAIDPMLLSAFVGALSLFGKDLGKIEEISIKGLDLNMIIISKYNLILVTIMDKDFMKSDIRNEAELALDLFYSSYSELINSEDACDVAQFVEFKSLLLFQIKDYFAKIEKEQEVGDFGFFTDFIKKLKANNNHL